MNTLLRICALLRPYWRYIIQALLTGVLVSVLALPGPFITKLLIDEVYPRQDVPLLHFVLLSGASMSVGLGLIQALASHFGQRMGVLMGFDFQSRLYAHIQRLDFGFFDGRETGELLSRFDDMQTSFGQVISLLDTTVINLLQLLVFPAVLFWLSWPLALMSLAVLPFDTVLALVTRRVYGRLSQAIAAGSAQLSAEAYEALAGVRTVQALGLEAHFLDRLRSRFLEVARLRIRASLVGSLSSCAGTTLRALGSLAYGYCGWLQVLHGNLSMGTFMAFSGYVAYLYGPVQNLLGLVPQMEVTRVHARRFLEIYDQRPAVLDAPAAIRLARARGRVELRQVWFGYGGDPVLRGVDLRVEEHSRVAIVGRSGSGKSTLVKLIPRFYDPQHGAVLVDGLDVRRYSLASLRAQIAYGMQGSRLFRGTVRENLSPGRFRPSAEIEDAARAACIHDVVTQLPQGYDTPVGEGGCGLSEGQKQRLALARVLLMDAPVLILDEPAAALDTESEQALAVALERVCAERTVIIIAHRLKTIRSADRIVVLEQGRIAEQGAHEQLLESDGIYARLWKIGAQPHPDPQAAPGV